MIKQTVIALSLLVTTPAIAQDNMSSILLTRIEKLEAESRALQEEILKMQEEYKELLMFRTGIFLKGVQKLVEEGTLDEHLEMRNQVDELFKETKDKDYIND